MNSQQKEGYLLRLSVAKDTLSNWSLWHLHCSYISTTIEKLPKKGIKQILLNMWGTMELLRIFEEFIRKQNEEKTGWNEWMDMMWPITLLSLRIRFILIDCSNISLATIQCLNLFLSNYKVSRPWYLDNIIYRKWWLGYRIKISFMFYSNETNSSTKFVLLCKSLKLTDC